MSMLHHVCRAKPRLLLASRTSVKQFKLTFAAGNPFRSAFFNTAADVSPKTSPQSDSMVMAWEARFRARAGPENRKWPVPHLDMEADYNFELGNLGSKSSNHEKLVLSAETIRFATDSCWDNQTTELRRDYQPKHLHEWFDKDNLGGIEANLDHSDIETMLAFGKLCKEGANLMDQKELRKQVNEMESKAVAGKGSVTNATMKIIKGLLNNIDSENPNAHANDLAVQHSRFLNDLYVAIGWLEKYYLFEDYNFTTGNAIVDFIPKHTISFPYTLTARLFGNHEEFTYYNHYVGSSCSNTREMQDMMRDVDFEDRRSITEWVQKCEFLYAFQLHDTPDTTGSDSNVTVLESEKYFRFIHLAMEMAWSANAGQIRHHLNRGADLSEDVQVAKGEIRKGLQLLLDTDIRMNRIFKTLPLGSDPKHYNPFLRPYIAGTWGANLGSVYEEKGKFFEGLGMGSGLDGNQAHFEKKQLECGSVVGKWKRHVGETGAGTSVRPIADEFGGGVSEVYSAEANKSIHMLTAALMQDDQAKVSHLCKEAVTPTGDERDAMVATHMAIEESGSQSEEETHTRQNAPAVSPLSLMLTMFRGMTRPYSHNQQMLEAKELVGKIKERFGNASGDGFADLDLVTLQTQLQMAALKHRTDHYKYVQKYINEPSKVADESNKFEGKQKKTAATGGTNTMEFLPDLTASNAAQAEKLMKSATEMMEEEKRKYDNFTKKLHNHRAINDRIKSASIKQAHAEGNIY